jgi:hypothetical protein
MSDYYFSLPLVIERDGDRGSVVVIDHEADHLVLRASLTLEQLDVVIAMLSDQRKQLADWEAGFLLL